LVLPVRYIVIVDTLGCRFNLFTDDLTEIRVVKNRSIAPRRLEPSYPTFMPPRST